MVLVFILIEGVHSGRRGMVALSGVQSSGIMAHRSFMTSKKL